jgi:hypothetical protein
MRSFSVALLLAAGILFCASSIMVAQEPNLRIFGISFGSGVRTADTRTELTGTFSEDGRYATFSLTVSVRNYGSKPARYKLQVQMERGARSDVLGDFDVAAGAVRRNEHYFRIDFAGVGGPFAIPLPEPLSRARAEVVLLNQEGRVLERKPFEVVLKFPRKRTDLRVEGVQILFEDGRTVWGRDGRWGLQSLPKIGHVTIRNVGTDTWGFRGAAILYLQRGTPETSLEDLGEPGVREQVGLPRGIPPGETRSVSKELLESARLPETGEILRIGPRLQLGTWYTLTVSIASEGDLNPFNDALQFVFMLDRSDHIQESRTIRITNRVRIVER